MKHTSAFLTAFALGRGIEQLTQRFAANDCKLPALIADIAISEPFLKP